MANCKNRNNPLIRKGECNFMFAKNSKAYSVYLLIRFVLFLRGNPRLQSAGDEGITATPDNLGQQNRREPR